MSVCTRTRERTRTSLRRRASLWAGVNGSLLSELILNWDPWAWICSSTALLSHPLAIINFRRSTPLCRKFLFPFGHCVSAMIEGISSHGNMPILNRACPPQRPVPSEKPEGNGLFTYLSQEVQAEPLRCLGISTQKTAPSDSKLGRTKGKFLARG
jgi:hypothetical protein